MHTVSRMYDSYSDAAAVVRDLEAGRRMFAETEAKARGFMEAYQPQQAAA